VSNQPSKYVPPRGFFDPDDLAVMERALQRAWSVIQTSDLLDLAKDEALKRAVCVKLFSVTRSKPIESRPLLDALLETLREDPAPARGRGAV
jgi:hypothetical protein